jgi:hypothetical protein
VLSARSHPRHQAIDHVTPQGGRFGGYGFYMLKGKPVFTWNRVDLKRIRWEGPQAFTPGRHTLEFGFTYDSSGFRNPGFQQPERHRQRRGRAQGRW